MITFLKTSAVVAFGGEHMNSFNKSNISQSTARCLMAQITKRNNKSSIINGTSAIIADMEPEGKFCSFDR